MTAGRGPAWWPMHLAFWTPLTFAVPLFVVLNNREDVIVSPPLAALALAMLTAALTGISAGLARPLTDRWRRRIALGMLTLSFVMVLQSNLIHELFYYGEFNGNAVNWRASQGAAFWWELVAFLAAAPLIGALLFRLKRVPALLAWLPVASCAVLLAPAVASYVAAPGARADENFDLSVFGFSAETNLIHLLPDGFQGDVVREVLDSSPDLQRAFAGFTLYADHLGMYQGTAPSVPTLMTGRQVAFTEGDSIAGSRELVSEHAYQNRLLAAGFRLDYVGGSTVYCAAGAASCVQRPFNDLKARGYARFRGESVGYAARLVADLTLFRLTPMYLKERIYNDGNWLFSDTTADGSSPYPGPVLREWTEHLEVVDGPPRYKWYHYIGTHLPAQWDRDCRFLRNLTHNRNTAAGQTRCVLRGLARFFDALRSAGIYDQTAIVISGDHGTNVAPADLTGRPPNASLTPRLIGHARPVLMIKPLASRAPLTASAAPTSLIDVAATALSLVGLAAETDGEPVSELTPDQSRIRHFYRYNPRRMWAGEPVPFTRFAVTGPAHVAASWHLQAMYTPEPAPSEYHTLSYTRAGAFIHGLALSRRDPDQQHAWVRSNHVAFLIRPSDPDPGRARRLALQLHIPDFVGPQRVTLTVNGKPVGEPLELAPGDEHWQQAAFAIPGGLIEDRNNFLELDFAVVGQAPEKPGFYTSALLRAIRLE